MAANDVELPWDDQTDQFIEAIDTVNTEEKKSETGLREILLNPNKYLGKEGIDKDVEALQAVTQEYFDEMLSGLEDEQKTLDQSLASADLSYSKIEGLIETKAAAARVPYIQPYLVTSNPDEREEITVEQYEESLDLLVGKLASVSNYIGNLSGSYKDHKLGSWVFSGSKSYILTVKAPESIIMDIERSSTLIKDMLNSISEGAKAVQKA